MSKRILFYFLYIVFVFIQVFFIDNFELKIGLIFLPLLLLTFKNNITELEITTFLLFSFYDLFKNNFVSWGLVIFLGINLVLNQLSRIWGKEILTLIKFFLVYLIFNYLNYGMINLNFLVNTLCILIIFGIRKVIKDGYIRFN